MKVSTAGFRALFVSTVLLSLPKMRSVHTNAFSSRGAHDIDVYRATMIV